MVFLPPSRARVLCWASRKVTLPGWMEGRLASLPLDDGPPGSSSSTKILRPNLLSDVSLSGEVCWNAQLGFGWEEGRGS
jgi:hypothetical protein